VASTESIEGVAARAGVGKRPYIDGGSSTGVLRRSRLMGRLLPPFHSRFREPIARADIERSDEKLLRRGVSGAGRAKSSRKMIGFSQSDSEMREKAFLSAY